MSTLNEMIFAFILFYLIVLLDLKAVDAASLFDDSLLVGFPGVAETGFVEHHLVKRSEIAQLGSNPNPVIKGKGVKTAAPLFTFPVWDETGRLCILAKFDAQFTINYPSQTGTQVCNLS